jgi:adenylate cyclase
VEPAAPLRKPLALVFCDIVGTMRLIAQEGDLVAGAAIREFFEHAGRLGREHHCLTMKSIGDGFLAAFEDIDDVMPFVISIKKSLLQNSAFAGPSLQLKFSVHYGDVLHIETSYGKEVLGEAVNLAARLNDLAQPNEMVISQLALERMPTGHGIPAGAIESVQLKGAREPVEFRRVNLLES